MSEDCSYSTQASIDSSLSLKLQRSPPTNTWIWHPIIIPIGIKGKLLVICMFYEMSWIYDNGKWKEVNNAAQTRHMNHDYEIRAHIVKIESQSTHHQLVLFASITDNNNYCYIIEYNIITNQIKWIERGSNKLDHDRNFLIPPNYDDNDDYLWWQTIEEYSFDMVPNLDCSSSILMMGAELSSETYEDEQALRSLFTLTLKHNPFMYETIEFENILPKHLSLSSPQFVRKTKDCKLMADSVILIATAYDNTDDTDEQDCDRGIVMFEINTNMNKGFDVKQLNVPNAVNQANKNQMTHFIFNDYLIVFYAANWDPKRWEYVDTQERIKYNECFIFGFKKMQWIKHFKFGSIFKYSAQCAMDHGVLHLFHDNRHDEVDHRTMDIGKMFNYRNEKYYAILDGLNIYYNMYETDLSKILFDFIDDGFILNCFERPWQSQEYMAMKRHKIWYELKKFINIDLYECTDIGYEHSLDFIKLLFNYLDEINVKEHHLDKPWNI
eukprot:307265_1